MKILIIKLGAKGDVVRTLSVLIALNEKYPDSEIDWITKQESLEIVKSSPYVKNVFNLSEIPNKKYDILYNFDIEEEATKLAMNITANKKYGFCLNEVFVSTFNLSAEYYLNTLFDDEIKRNNKKTYQQMMFDAAELQYKKQHHPIILTEREKKYSIDFLKNNNLFDKKIVGIHLGASSRWPSKAWHEDNLIEFIKKIKLKGYEILLFGGPNEVDFHKKIYSKLNKQGISIYSNNPLNSDLEFASLVDICKYIVCGDSFALHISLALRKPTIGLFFCTSANEVEDYDLLKKIVSPMLYDFFPEKSDQYSEELTKSISVNEVINIFEEIEKSSY